MGALRETQLRHQVGAAHCQQKPYPGRQTTGRFPGRQGRDPTCRPGRYHEGGRAVPSDICEKREISMRSVLVYRQTQQCVFGVKTNIFGPISGPGHVRASDAGRRGFLEANLNGKGQGAGVRSRKLSIGWGGRAGERGRGQNCRLHAVRWHECRMMVRCSERASPDP